MSQVIGQMPQDQFQQLMGVVSAGGMPGAGMGGMRGMPPGAGPGGNVIRLTEEEGAAVARLAELGFDRTDAAQVSMALRLSFLRTVLWFLRAVQAETAHLQTDFAPPKTFLCYFIPGASCNF